MSRDLFAETVATRHAPPRSKWTILGSLLAHVGVLGALLVIPIVSALDNFVLHANDALTFSMPAVAVPPPSPPPPASSAPAIAQDIKVDAAPLTSSDNQRPVEPSFVINSVGSGVPGAVGGAPGGIDFAPPPATPPPAVTPAAKPTGPIRAGGQVNSPQRITYVEPTYPAAAKSVRLEGNVILEATIDESGAVRDVRVLRSIPLLDQAAIAAVSRWRYTPTRLNGVAVPVLLTVTVSFTINR